MHICVTGIPASDAEYWLLDRSLSWHYMTSSFTAYFRQMLLHLGLPHWHLVYTDIGLPPQAMVCRVWVVSLFVSWFVSQIISSYCAQEFRFLTSSPSHKHAAG